MVYAQRTVKSYFPAKGSRWFSGFDPTAGRAKLRHDRSVQAERASLRHVPSQFSPQA